MGFLTRFLGRQDKPAEARSLGSDSYARAFGIAPTSAGGYVSPHLAENLAAVLACTNAISSALASLPAYCYRATTNGRVEQPDHPVARLMRRPNAHQTWPDFLEWLVAQSLLHGNGIAVVEYDGAGRPTALQPVPWGNVQVLLLPSGRLAYDVTQFTAPWGGAGMPRRYLEGEVLHLRDRSDDGVVGRSRISRAREVLGAALALQEFTGSMWANGATPSGALKFPHNLTGEQFNTIRARVQEQYTGPRNARRVILLESGVEWTPLSVSPEDAEVLASRRFTVEELCRLFQVPPPIVQDLSHGTFTNSREAGRWFAQFTLAPWCRKIEAEFSRSIFTDPALSLEIDMSGLMRADAEARWQSHKIAVDAGILEPDEIREIEGWNPRKRGEESPVA